jgi:hypothetical protein
MVPSGGTEFSVAAKHIVPWRTGRHLQFAWAYHIAGRILGRCRHRRLNTAKIGRKENIGRPAGIKHSPKTRGGRLPVAGRGFWRLNSSLTQKNRPEL